MSGIRMNEADDLGWLVPVTNAPGERLFEPVEGASLVLTGTRTFSSGVLVLTYVPAAPAGQRS